MQRTQIYIHTYIYIVFVVVVVLVVLVTNGVSFGDTSLNNF